MTDMETKTFAEFGSIKNEDTSLESRGHESCPVHARSSASRAIVLANGSEAKVSFSAPQGRATAEQVSLEQYLFAMFRFTSTDVETVRQNVANDHSISQMHISERHSISHNLTMFDVDVMPHDEFMRCIAGERASFAGGIQSAAES